MTRSRDPRRLAAAVMAVLLGLGLLTIGAPAAHAETQDLAPTRVIIGADTTQQTTHGVAVDSAGRIYSGNEDGRITVFAPDADGNVPPIRTIDPPQDVNYAIGMYINPTNDHLWVAYNSGNAIEWGDWASGQITPLRVLGNVFGENYMASSRGIVLDSQGLIYVGSADNGYVSVFAADADGEVAPLRQIFLPDDAGQVLGLSIDGEDNLYVAVGTTVRVFAPGATGEATPIRTITGIQYANGLVVDGESNLYVSDRDVPAILRFAPGADGAAEPTLRIEGPSTQLSSVFGITIGPDGSLVAANTTAPSITVYGDLGTDWPPPNVTAVRVTRQARALAVSARITSVGTSAAVIVQCALNRAFTSGLVRATVSTTPVQGTRTITARCAGLRPDTLYWVKVGANNGIGSATYRGSFRTLKVAKRAQTLRGCSAIPARVKLRGVTVLREKICRTNAGQALSYRFSANRAGPPEKLIEVLRGPRGRLAVRTFGWRNVRIRVVMSAPATPQYLAFEKVRILRTPPYS